MIDIDDVISVMRLYDGSRTIFCVDSELSEELEVNVRMHEGSVLLPFHFALVVDFVTSFARECAKWVIVCKCLSPDE